MQVKYFNKASLLDANNEAIISERNRSLRNESIVDTEDDTLFPIVFSMPHNDVEMRVQLMLDPTTRVWLDMPFKAYEALPSIEYPTQ
jgi:hypothetical protein|tara:strand:- start:213 stop:473 length:261 start_codon:yes stop_codon:yes gene_type:complete